MNIFAKATEINTLQHRLSESDKEVARLNKIVKAQDIEMADVCARHKLELEKIVRENDMEASLERKKRKVEVESLKVDYENEAQQREDDARLEERKIFEKDKIALEAGAMDSLNNETEARAKYEELKVMLTSKEKENARLESVINSLIKRLPEVSVTGIGGNEIKIDTK